MRLLCLRTSPGKNTGVGCHSLLQWIFLSQGSKPGLLHCRQVLYHLSHQGGSLVVDAQQILARTSGNWGWSNEEHRSPRKPEKWLLVGPDDRVYRTVAHHLQLLFRFASFFPIPTNKVCLRFMYFFHLVIAAYS